MIEGLVGLLILVLIIGIVLWLLLYCINLLPMEEPFKQIAKVVLILICVLIIIARALPLLGLHVI